MTISAESYVTKIQQDNKVIRLFDMTVSEGTNDRLIMTIYVYD